MDFLRDLEVMKTRKKFCAEPPLIIVLLLLGILLVVGGICVGAFILHTSLNRMNGKNS